MPAFPDYPTALLKMTSLFTAPGWQASERERFAAMNMRFAAFENRAKTLLDLLRDALSLRENLETWQPFLVQLDHFGTRLDRLALHTTTYGADERQILWILCQDLAPGLGRTWGFWSRTLPISRELPGGDLWFLPQVAPKQPERLILPVETAATWWRGLLDSRTEQIWEGRDEDVHRTLQGWLSGRVTPELKSIHALFPDAQTFRYRDDIGAPPSVLTIRKLLLWARAIERGWKDLVATLSPDVAASDPDPMRNKALQLVELFRLAHELTVAAGHDDIAFTNSVPEWLADGPFRAILPQPGGAPPSPEDCAQRMSLHFMTQSLGDPRAPLADIFCDHSFVAPAAVVADQAIFEARTAVSNCLSRGRSERASDHPDRAMLVKTALAQAKAHPSAADLKANILYLEACDALSRGAFDVAGKVLDRGLELCTKGGFGPIRLEIARLHFALAVACAAFDQNRCEAAFRVFVRALSAEEAAGWRFPEGPIEYTMRLAAKDLSDWFWEHAFRPYPGVEIARISWDQMPVFEDWRALLRAGADGTKIGAFCARGARQIVA